MAKKPRRRKRKKMPTELKGQQCPMCRKKNLVLREELRDIPNFGKMYVFSMTCSNCKYHKSDVEAAEQHEPMKYTLEVSDQKDLNIKIVKSSEATIKIPHIVTITPGPASQGYITNVEGILQRVKDQVEEAKNDAEDKADRKKSKNLLKKLQKIIGGQEKAKIIIEDPTGNSAILSDKVVKSKLK